MPRQDSVTGGSLNSGPRSPTPSHTDFDVRTGQSHRCELRIRLGKDNAIYRASAFEFHTDYCLFIAEDGSSVLRQVFAKNLARYPFHPWTHSDHRPFELTFTPAVAEHFKLYAGSDKLSGIPKFEFVNGTGYGEYQRQLRGKRFVAEFKTKEIRTSSSGRNQSDDSYIKVWEELDGKNERTVSLPLDDGNRKLYILEVPFRFFECEESRDFWPKRAGDALKLVLNRVRRPSTIVRAIRRNSGMEALPDAPQNTGEAAPEPLRAEYGFFRIVFTSAPGEKSPEAMSDKQKFRDLHACRPLSSKATDSEITLASSSVMTGLSSPIGTPDTRELSSTPESSAPTLFSNTLGTNPGLGISPQPPTEPPPLLVLPAQYPSPLLHGETIQEMIESEEQESFTQDNSEDRKEARFFIQAPGIYNQLQPNEIRLLCITQGKDKQALECSLTHYNLSSVPSYEAVSYCWGPLGQPKDIMMPDDQGFKVTKHLLAGLRRLRLEERDRLVWIDAVCINQNDIQEKNNQIPLMREIYQKSKRTLVWIGDLGMDQPNCQRRYRAHGDEPAEATRADLTLCTHGDFQNLLHGEVNIKDKLRQFKKTMEETGSVDVWWKRVWVIQEYHFSTEPPTVYIGPHSIEWDHFDTLLCQPTDKNQIDYLETFRELGTPVYRSLFDLLCSARSFHCGDERDRVYGMLSMHYDQPNGECDAGDDQVQRLQPDYAKSLAKVLEETCLYLVRESRSVDVLLDRRVDRRIRSSIGRPGTYSTWIPELTSIVPRSAEPLDERSAGIGQNRMKSVVSIITLRSSQPSVRLWPSILSMQGVRFEIITRRTTKLDFDNFLTTVAEMPSGRLIYNSLDHRGHLLGMILNKLEYDYTTSTAFDRLERRPYLSQLMLDYVFEGKRSFVKELKVKLEKRPKVSDFEEQCKRDLAYVERDNDDKIFDAAKVPADVAHITNRWNIKLKRADKDMFIPERLQKLLDDNEADSNEIRSDFKVAREYENLFAYARTTQNRYYISKTEFDAPMRSDVLACNSRDDLDNLVIPYTDEQDPEYHAYDAKNRERDFFITEGGFIGLGSSVLEVGDILVVPLGSGWPWILREVPSNEMPCYRPCYRFIGEAVVPSIMSGDLLVQPNAKPEEFWVV